MSTPSGTEGVVAAFVDQAKDLLTEAQAEQARQDDLFQPTPEEMLVARQQLPTDASHLDLVRHARRGRPAGAKNKRTDDFAKYILGFGQHPAITLMQIQATAPEILMQASKRKREQAYRDKDGKVIEYTESMSYAEAQSLRIRCAAELLPYLESKRPVAIDVNWTGVADMMIEGLTHTREQMDDARRQKEAVDGEFYEIEGVGVPDAEPGK